MGFWLKMPSKVVANKTMVVFTVACRLLNLKEPIAGNQLTLKINVPLNCTDVSAAQCIACIRIQVSLRSIPRSSWNFRLGEIVDAP